MPERVPLREQTGREVSQSADSESTRGVVDVERAQALGDREGASAKAWEREPRETTYVPLNRLIADGGVHARRRVLPQTIFEYHDLSHEEAGKLPPVTAFYDPADPNFYWLADGFLRTYAWRRAGHKSVPVKVLPGTRRDAMLYACGTNAEHGVRRSRNDKWCTVVAMLQEPEWAAESDSWIAEKCAVSVTFVKQVREDCVTPEAFVEARLRRDGIRKKGPARMRSGRRACAKSTRTRPRRWPGPSRIRRCSMRGSAGPIGRRMPPVTRPRRPAARTLKQPG